MFHNPFPDAFGLDIGDLSLKLVQLRNVSLRSRHPSYRLEEARSISLPPGLIVDGIFEQPEQVRHYIKKLLDATNKQKRISSPWVVASLPETHGFIKLLTIQKSIDDIIEDDILITAKKHIPFDDKDSYYLDWEIITPTSQGDETNILISAIPRQVADTTTYLLESLGLGVVALEIEALSIARSMVTATKIYEGEARALLDIGATRSSLVVYDDQSVRFSISLPFSGELLTTAISQSLHNTHEEAEKMKHEYGLAYRKEKKLWATEMKLVKEFATQVRKAIHFYYSHFNEAHRITHITMCGGTSNLKYLEKILSLELKIECRPGNVWKNLASSKKILIEPQKALSYATAIGLALRAADNPFFTFDSI